MKERGAGVWQQMYSQSITRLETHACTCYSCGHKISDTLLLTVTTHKTQLKPLKFLSVHTHSLTHKSLTRT